MERPGTTKTTKAERRKKFNKFKDTAHKCFGEPFTVVGVCLKKCSNRKIKCNKCYKFSELKEIK
jgi:hypothetical protein